MESQELTSVLPYKLGTHPLTLLGMCILIRASNKPQLATTIHSEIFVRDFFRETFRCAPPHFSLFLILTASNKLQISKLVYVFNI